MGSSILLGTDFSKRIQVRSRHIGHISKDRSYKQILAFISVHEIRMISCPDMLPTMLINDGIQQIN